MHVGEVMKSVWRVIDAVNNHPMFDIESPASHMRQQQIAKEFERKSGADFKCCAGAIDGILIWIHKPTKKRCAEEAGCVDGEFVCGLKGK
jgi:hypothetical protein